MLMGQPRSLRKLAAMTNTHLSTLQNWSTQFGWQKRLDEYDAKIIKTMQKDSEKKYMEEIKQGHQKMYQELQNKAMTLIRKKNRITKFDTVKDLTIAADVAIKGERTTLGLNDTKLKGGIVKEGFMAMMELVMQGNGESGT